MKGEFSNMKIFSAEKACRPHHVHYIAVIPEGCKIAIGDDAFKMKPDVSGQLR